jgi:hypothetical protein
VASIETAKRATVTVNGLRNSDQLGGKIRFKNTAQQTQRLMRRHLLTAASAELLAPFVFGEMAQQ